MAQAIKLNTFGSQTLHSADFILSEVIDGGASPADSLYLMSDLSYFDAAGSGTNTLIPTAVIATIKVTGSSAANYTTNTEAIAALNGTKNTLTGEMADGSTKTLTARCTVQPVNTKTDSFVIPLSVYRLTFKKLTDWT